MLTGKQGDAVFRIFYGATMAFLLLVVAEAPRLRKVPFAVPYWAYTFPLTAASVMALVAAATLPGAAYDVVAYVVVAVTTVVVVAVSVLTLVAAARRQICVPE